MKITFPHMGTLHIPGACLFRELGHEVVVAPQQTKRTLDLGTKYSPEWACLPLKLTVGNYIEALEKGADTIVMAGGTGPCRFGYYAEVQRQILSELGYNYTMIVVEPPDQGLPELLGRLSALKGDKGPKELWRAMRLAWEKFKACDRLEQQANWSRAVEKTPRAVSRCLERALTAVDRAATVPQVKQAVADGLGAIRACEIPGAKPKYRIGFVGEIYTVLEPFVNMQIEEKLGMLGAYVDRTIYLSQWIRQHVFLSFRNKAYHRRLSRESAPYLNHFVGGHGLESVAHTLRMARAGYDGVVHILPFTCMPEVVAQSVLQKISRQMNFPVLTLVVDEHTGEAGFDTRLEAFVDLIQRRKSNSFISTVQ
ncbi:MAG TPA: CoA protein activase [Firmicutes bacterium]|nr:CoA protein activase [Bacillota bacterium]